MLTGPATVSQGPLRELLPSAAFTPFEGLKPKHTCSNTTAATASRCRQPPPDTSGQWLRSTGPSTPATPGFPSLTFGDCPALAAFAGR